jgi:hypothetical protein
MNLAQKIKQQVALYSDKDAIQLRAWCLHELPNRFRDSSVVTIKVQERICISNLSHTEFLTVLQGEGFDIAYVCERRPCGSCHYELRLPE